jgi:RecA/RadA recombinase
VTAITPDFDLAKRHIALLTGRADAPVCIQTFADNDKHARQLARVMHGEISTFWEQIISLQARGAGIFITVNETDGRGREAANVTKLRAVWADMDDPSAAPPSFPLQPHIVVATSPGKWHCVWLTEAPDRHQHEGVLKRISADFGADPNATGVNRVLRLAGTVHQKDPNKPFLVTLRTAAEVRAPYTWADLIAVFPPLVASAPAHVARADDYELIRRLQSDELGLHDAMLRFTARLAAKGFDQSSAFEITRGLIQLGEGAARWNETDRDGDMLRAIEGAFQKYAVQGFADAEANGGRYSIIRGEMLRAFPHTVWRIKGILPESGLASVYGPSGSGKTFLCLCIAAAIAEGGTWFAHKVRAADVIYVALEGEGGIKQRSAAWEMHHNRPLPPRLGFVLSDFAIATSQDIADLSAAVPRGGVVFIDTLNRAAPEADENSSADMGRIIKGAKELQRRTEGLVVLVHHTGKDASRGLRGHSSLNAALDTTIEVSRPAANGSREWRVAKSKDGRDGETHCFDLVECFVGSDEDGDTISSCAVVPVARGGRGCSQAAVARKPARV